MRPCALVTDITRVRTRTSHAGMEGSKMPRHKLVDAACFKSHQLSVLVPSDATLAACRYSFPQRTDSHLPSMPMLRGIDATSSVPGPLISPYQYSRPCTAGCCAEKNIT